jgi:hypothetical protein
MKTHKYNMDVKHTVWERTLYYIKADTKEQADMIISDIANGELMDSEHSIGDIEVLYDTMEYITTDENGGYSTVEVYDERGSLVYDNTNN